MDALERDIEFFSDYPDSWWKHKSDLYDRCEQMYTATQSDRAACLWAWVVCIGIPEPGGAVDMARALHEAVLVSENSMCGCENQYKVLRSAHRHLAKLAREKSFNVELAHILLWIDDVIENFVFIY